MFTLFKKTKTAPPLITAEELAYALSGGNPPRIVDVRSPEEYTAGRLPGAVNIPRADLEARAADLDPNALIVLY